MTVQEVGRIGEATYYHVSGRGYGKTVMLNAALEEQRRRAGELLGFSVGPVDAKNPQAEQFERWSEVLGIRMEPWQARWAANVLGHWGYTPADELRDRLNDGLKGKEPRPAINTRYWRNL